MVDGCQSWVDADLASLAVARVRVLDHRATAPDVVTVAARLASPGLPVGVPPDPRTAELCRTLGLPAEVTDRVVDLLHRVAAGPPDPGTVDVEPGEPDRAVLSDALLEPLSDAATYRRWRAVVRTSADWARVRRGLLDRDTIFVTPESRGSREGAARLHLARDLTDEQGGATSRP